MQHQNSLQRHHFAAIELKSAKAQCGGDQLQLIKPVTNSNIDMQSSTSYRQTSSSIQITQNKGPKRKILPMPILSLQTKEGSYPIMSETKRGISVKPVVRKNFKKMLDILNKHENKDHYIPVNFESRVNKSKEMLHKRIKINNEFYRSNINFLLLRTQLCNEMKLMEVNNKTREEEDVEQNSSKATAPNLQRTIRLRKTSKKGFVQQPNTFKKLEKFCSAISYQSKFVKQQASLNLKNSKPQRSYLKMRSQSTLGNINAGQDINGWEDGPVRYITDYDRVDFSDIYQ